MDQTGLIHVLFTGRELLEDDFFDNLTEFPIDRQLLKDDFFDNSMGLPIGRQLLENDFLDNLTGLLLLGRQLVEEDFVKEDFVDNLTVVDNLTGLTKTNTNLRLRRKGLQGDCFYV